MKIFKGIIATIIVVVLIIIIALVIKSNMNNNKYELEKIEKYSYFKLYKNEKYGVIDEKGNTIINASYDTINIPNPSKAVFICYSGNNSDMQNYTTKVLNEKGEPILTQYEQVSAILCETSISNIPFEKSVLMYKENDKYGIIDFAGNKITQANYDQIESLPYREGCLKVQQNGKYGVINIKGKEIIDIKYNNVTSDQYFKNELGYMEAGFIVEIKTENGYRYGYYNKNGNEIIKDEYNAISRITQIEDENAYLIISKNGKYGVMKNNQIVIPTEYENIEYNKSCNVFVTKRNMKQGVISINGNEILPVEYDDIQCYIKRITAQKGDSVEIYNNNGEKQKLKYENTIETENEDYIIYIDADYKFGVMSPNGQTLIKNEYDNLEYAYEKYFIATQNGKVGVISINGDNPVEFQYDIIQKIKGKKMLQAIVTSDNVIDIFNNEIKKQVSMQNAVLYTHDEYIKLISENEMNYLDNNGDVILNKQIFTNNKLFSYNKDGKWGFANSNDEIVVKPQYDFVTEFNQYGYAGIKKDGKWGVIDQEGNTIINPTYKIDWNEPDFISKYYKSNFGYGFEYYTEEL